MPLATAQQYIDQALRKCGQMRPGYHVQPELYQDGLNEWWLLFDEWATDRTMGFSVPTYTYTVNGPGSQSGGNGYLIGPTANIVGNANDFQGPRPNMIIRANNVLNNVGSQPVYIPLRPISAEEWAALSIRQIPAINVTNVFYYDPQFPNGVFNVFPPLNGNGIELFCSQALAVPASLSAQYAAPPGYADAVVWSLAERLWPMCTKQLAINAIPYTTICGKAYAARQKIQIINRPIPELRNDFRGGLRPDGFYDANVSWTGEPY